MKLSIIKNHAFKRRKGEDLVEVDRLNEALQKTVDDWSDHLLSKIEVNVFCANDWGYDSGTANDPLINPQFLISLGTAWGTIGCVDLEKALLGECAGRNEIADYLEVLAAKIRNPRRFRRWQQEQLAKSNVEKP